MAKALRITHSRWGPGLRPSPQEHAPGAECVLCARHPRPERCQETTGADEPCRNRPVHLTVRNRWVCGNHRQRS